MGQDLTESLRLKTGNRVATTIKVKQSNNRRPFQALARHNLANTYSQGWRGWRLWRLMAQGPNVAQTRSCLNLPDIQNSGSVLGICGSYKNPVCCSRDAIGQADIPPAFALIHLQNQAGVAGWIFKRDVQEQKIRPELGNGHRPTVKQELNLYLGGMSAIVNS